MNFSFFQGLCETLMFYETDKQIISALQRAGFAYLAMVTLGGSKLCSRVRLILTVSIN